MRRSHNIYSVASLCVNSNCCPNSGIILASRSRVVKHLANSILRGHCVTNKVYNLSCLCEPRSHNCRACGLEYSCSTEHDRHVVLEHLPHLPVHHGRPRGRAAFFLQPRRRLASRSAQGERESKQARVVEEAEEAAAEAEGGGRKPGKQAILIQLVLILSRMCLLQSRELSEIIGVLFRCVLLPVAHITAVLTMEGGDEYQEMVNERREKLGSTTAKKKKKGGQESEDDEIEEQSKEDVEQLPSPHLHIALKAIAGTIQKGAQGETPAANTIRIRLKEAWDSSVKGKSET